MSSIYGSLMAIPATASIPPLVDCGLTAFRTQHGIRAVFHGAFVKRVCPSTLAFCKRQWDSPAWREARHRHYCLP
jgi:hypothetical protein